MRFEHKNGPGTVVKIGTRRFPMPYETDDPKEIRLLRKNPRVSEAKKPKPTPKVPLAEVVDEKKKEV
ncbi:MAG: hypothetical protein JW990_07740 [Thermoleophilia bacterium]|nr:hypothetical protein [Thermoleophilia bacterium]